MCGKVKISPFLTQRGKNPVDRSDFQVSSCHVSLSHGRTGSDLLPRHCAAVTRLPIPVHSIVYALTLWPVPDLHSPFHSVPYIHSFLVETPTLVLLPLWWASLSSAPQVSYASINSSTLTFWVHRPCQLLVKWEWSLCLPCPVTPSCELDGVLDLHFS